MKLLNKLLPIATISSVTAVVAPMVTSCAYNTLIDASIEPDTKGWKHYQSDTVKLDLAAKYYRDALIQDKSILDHDLQWGRNYLYKNLIDILFPHELNDEIPEIVEFSYTKKALSYRVSGYTEIAEAPAYCAPLVTLKDKVHLVLGTPNVADKQYYDKEIQLDFDINMVDTPILIGDGSSLFGAGVPAILVPAPLEFTIATQFESNIGAAEDFKLLLLAISTFNFQLNITETRILRDETTHQETLHKSQSASLELSSKNRINELTQIVNIFANKLSPMYCSVYTEFFGAAWFSYYYSDVSFEH